MYFLPKHSVYGTAGKDTNTPNTVEDQSIDTAFRKIKHSSIGFYKWKVDNQRIEAVLKDQYDVFNDNCVYIIYAACPKGSYVNKDTISREVKLNVQIDKYIHFWLGTNASQYETGNVAYKVMELDSHLNNVATQFRESQDNESDRFMSYFKEGLLVRSSIFNDSKKVKLFHIKGKIGPICTERAVQWDSFSSEFILILKTENYIFLWIGRSSEQSERLHGLKFARRFQELERNLELVVINDGYEQSLNEAKKSDWSLHLPLSNRRVKPIENSTVMVEIPPLKLYKCGFTGGKYRIEERKSSIFDQNDLNDKNSAFIVDCGEKGVWIWLGKNCPSRDKCEAMRNARGFVKKKQYPPNVLVVRTIDGYEPDEFKNLFAFWNNGQATKNKTTSLLGRIDTKILIERVSLAADTQLIDDGTGEVMIYKVLKFNLVKVPKRHVQALYSTECYVIHYTLIIPENNLTLEQSFVRHILYLWIGKQCPLDTRVIGERLWNELFQHLKKNVMQIRLNDGFETPHFYQIFSGKLIVFLDAGGSTEEYKLPKVFLLKVIGNTTFNSRAIQINYKSSFSCKECMILKCYDSLWVWCGTHSTGDSREFAKLIGGTLGDFTLITESNEPEDFWNSLPDHIEYNFRNVSNCNEDRTFEVHIERTRVRLFVCSFIQGMIKFEQIIAFSQNDMKPEDVFLLDIDCMVYIWIGSSSVLPSQHFNGQDIVEVYLKWCITRRNKCVPTAIIQQGFEPSSFIGFFEQWNYKQWISHQTFNDQIANYSNSNMVTQENASNKANQTDFDFDNFPKYPIGVLQNEASELPEAVDPKSKEIHLTNDDFVSIFDMKFSEFQLLPNWRKQELKKKFKLF